MVLRWRGGVVAMSWRRVPALALRVPAQKAAALAALAGASAYALLAGLGIGTMPQRWIEEDIKAGRLKVISPEYRHQIQVVLAWRRDTMGKAKSWLVREIPKLFPCKGE